MTVLVAVESPDGVWLGTDSFLGSEGVRDLHDGPKWRRVGPLVVAFAGSVRFAQGLAGLKVKGRPKRGESVPDWLARVVVAPLLEAGTWSRSGSSGSSLLMLCGGRIYEMGDDLGIARSARGFAAAGAGYEYAYGSLHSTSHMDAPFRVRAALEAACEFSPLCCAPLHVEVFA